MVIYPYNAAIILTDSIFNRYGGQLGSSTAEQRAAAYWLAEIEMSTHLATFLLPTTITGTYPWPYPERPVTLEHAHIRSIKNVTVLSNNSDCDCDLDEYEGCAFVLSDTYGYIWVRETESSCCGGCHCHPQPPLTFRVAYECGLASGTSYQPNMLLALTMLADNELKQMYDPAALEGGAGDVGVQSWSSLSYSEQRMALGNFAFGNSPVANKVARLVERFRPKRALRFH